MYIYNYWKPYSHSVFKIIVFLRDFLKEQIELVLTTFRNGQTGAEKGVVKFGSLEKQTFS